MPLQELTQVLAPYTDATLLQLLDAAASSPGALYRQPSVECALFCTLMRNRGGNARAGIETLQAIVDAARTAVPQLALVEDWVPLDPRLTVLIRWYDRLLRLHPGAQERPVAIIERARLVAEVIDSTVLARRGFYLTDLLDVSLRYTDLAISTLAPTWNASIPLRQDGSVAISRQEVAAAGALADIQSVLRQCRHPDQAAAALAWATRTPSTLRFDLTDTTAPMGPVIAVRLSPGGLQALPAGLQLGACASATSTLAAEVTTFQPGWDDAFRTRSNARVTELLTRLRQPLVADPHIAGAGLIHSLIPTSDRHALAVGVASSLQHRDLESQIEALVDRLERIRPGAPYRSGDRVGTIPDDAELTRVLVVSSADHLVVTGPPGVIMMTLDDLEWIAHTADSPDDLYWFCRELTETRSSTSLFMWETMNVWEWWRRNGKAMHHAGHAPGVIAGAHLTEAEWTEAAKNAPVESDLLALGLAHYRTWEAVNVEGDWIRLIDRCAGVAWSIIRTPRLVAVRYELGTRPDKSLLDITYVGEALLCVIQQVAEPFDRVAANVLGASPLHIVFRYGNTDGRHGPLHLEGTASSTIIIEWDERLWNYGVQNPNAIQSLLGKVIVEGLTALTPHPQLELADALASAWASAPPALAMTMISVPQRVHDLPPPVAVPDTVRAGLRRDLASYLAQQRVGPGAFTDDDAVQLESTIIYPYLVAKLRTAWAGYSREGLLEVATTQLECAAAARTRQRKDLESNIRSMPIQYDPVQHSMEREHNASVLMGALTTIIDLALQQPPTGADAPDKHAWENLLAIAELCVESGRRGESVRYGLMPMVTEVSGQYEIDHTESGDPLFDFNAFRRAQVADTLPAMWNRAAAEQVEVPLDDATVESPPSGLLTVRPTLAAIDSALRASKCCGLETMMGVLARLEAWPVMQGETVGEATRDEVAAFCCEDGVLPEAEVVGALNTLTLRHDLLATIDIEPWEYSRRRFRLVTQPVIEVQHGRLLILPWWIGQSFRTYALYVDDGRLPWPDSSIDPPLKKALDRYRETLNRALEDEVASLVTQSGFKARSRVNKARVLNLPALSGEIDVIAAFPSGDIIWVLEVKDPSHAYSIAEMRRAVDRFHEPKKGWVAKLLRKVEDVQADTVGVAQDLGLSAAKRQVRGVIVTRRPVPAAYVPNSPVPFVTIAELLDWLGPRS